VTALLDDGGSPITEYLYDPFGIPLARTGSLDQEFRFSTKRYDEATGLSDYGYRFYSPVSGRWLTRDPIGEIGGANLYAAVNDNPINRVDTVGRVPSPSTSGPTVADYLQHAANLQLLGEDDAAMQALADAMAEAVARGPADRSVAGLLAYAGDLQLLGADEAAEEALAEARALAVQQGPGACATAQERLEHTVILQLLGVE